MIDKLQIEIRQILKVYVPQVDADLREHIVRQLVYVDKDIVLYDIIEDIKTKNKQTDFKQRNENLKQRNEDLANEVQHLTRERDIIASELKHLKGEHFKETMRETPGEKAIRKGKIKKGYDENKKIMECSTECLLEELGDIE